MQASVTVPCPKTQAAVDQALAAGIPIATILAILAAVGTNLPALLAFLQQIKDLLHPSKP